MTENTPPDVRPGQVWADNDPRSAGRTFRVISITAGGRVQCVVLTPPTAWPATRVGHSVSIAARRLRPTARGYRLVSDAPGTTA